jgi:serine/threonine protein kinase
VTALPRGRSLSMLMQDKKEKKMTENQARSIASQLFTVLKYLFYQTITHQEIDASNVIIMNNCQGADLPNVALSGFHRATKLS